MTARPAEKRVCLVALYPGSENTILNSLPNYGVRRVQAGLLARPDLADVEIRLVETASRDLDTVQALVEDTAPTIVGLSTYIWSFPWLFELARRLKRTRPDRLIIAGGPAAHPAMFGLAEYADLAGVLDAVVVGEGECTFADVVALHDHSPAALQQIPGLHLPSQDGWVPTSPRPPAPAMDAIPSAYQAGLMPPGFGYIETYKGCPLSCSYCEWGTLDGGRKALSREYLVRELRAMQRAGVDGLLMIDAGLNLHPHAFRHLKAAEEEVGFLRHVMFNCEVYPAHMTDEHMEFLLATKQPEVGMGLQSMDKEVLRRLDRPFDDQKFESVVRDIAAVVPVTIEIIMGLPGDNAASFRRTFERVSQLPCSLRVYHCVVLPSGLMSRAPAHFDLRFNPRTLKMESCWGWATEDLRRETAFLDGLAARDGGFSGDFLWYFQRDAVSGRRPSAAARRPPSPQAFGGNLLASVDAIGAK